MTYLESEKEKQQLVWVIVSLKYSLSCRFAFFLLMGCCDYQVVTMDSSLDMLRRWAELQMPVNRNSETETAFR